MYIKDMIRVLSEMPNMLHNVKGINSHRENGSYTIELALGDHGYEVYSESDEIDGIEPIEVGQVPETIHELAELLQHFVDDNLCLEGYKGGYYPIKEHSEVAIVWTWGDYGDCLVDLIDDMGIHSPDESIEFTSIEG